MRNSPWRSRCRCAGAVIVSTPQDLALIDARRGIAMFKRVNVPILGIVENMSYFLCPQCGTRSDIFGHGGARHEAERLNVPFLGEVPLDMTIRETSDAGLPVVATEPDGPHAKIYRAHRRAGARSAGGSRRRPRCAEDRYRGVAPHDRNRSGTGPRRNSPCAPAYFIMAAAAFAAMIAAILSPSLVVPDLGAHHVGRVVDRHRSVSRLRHRPDHPAAAIRDAPGDDRCADPARPWC